MEYYTSVLMFGAISTIGTLGTFVLTGLTGLFSLGQAAFMAIGAYSAAMGVVRYNLPFAPAVILSVGIAVGLAYIIGYATLNLRQDYFALSTFGFGEAVRAVLTTSVQLTGGALGMTGIPKLTTGPLVVISLVVVVWLIRNVRVSRFGRECVALRLDETAAQAMGVDVFWRKMQVFMLGAALSAYAGALLAFYTSYAEPNMFGWMRSVEWIIMVFLGGRDSLTGALLGSFVLNTAPEVLRFASQMRTAIYCILILVTLNLRPRGLLGAWELSFSGIFGQRRSAVTRGGGSQHVS
ncbi:MAG TPA: branched-chain amino acid ABC transporter permease [Firmicutes bacterium]|nr:branched-chain amino acid ABC transporter permease [Bacillota bacterium]